MDGWTNTHTHIYISPLYMYSFVKHFQSSTSLDTDCFSEIKHAKFLRKTNENGSKTLSFNDKDKIKGKVNGTKIDFLV